MSYGCYGGGLSENLRIAARDAISATKCKNGFELHADCRLAREWTKETTSIQAVEDDRASSSTKNKSIKAKADDPENGRNARSFDE